jgi:hypothetical protein
MSFKRFSFSYRETITTILTENEKYYKIAVMAILEARNQIESHISLYPEFFTSYEPVECVDADDVVIRMCNAARIAKVGPMAAVAGTIAGYAVEKMVQSGAEIAVVDNGGDIAIHTGEELLIGIYPSELAFRVDPVDFLAICTSSGKIGHSVSFGYADAATVIAKDASIADALATALGNRIGKDFGKQELEETVSDFYTEFKNYVEGILIIKDEFVALAGNLPEIVGADVKPELITKG